MIIILMRAAGAGKTTVGTADARTGHVAEVALLDSRLALLEESLADSLVDALVLNRRSIARPTR